MMKLQGNKLLVMLICTLCFSLVKAQSFRYQTLTDTVPQTGFYSIPITPELSAHMQVGFGDVRLLDEKEKQVPYIIRGHKPQWQSSLFTPYSILKNNLDDSGRSIIIIHKSNSAVISNLFFIIKNASVSRNASLSGSNDQKQWFIIRDNLLINNSYETLTDSSIQSISFPPSSYLYYRLVINNENSDPFNILEIGAYNYGKQVTSEQYVTNPTTTIVQTDSSNGISYIRVQQKPTYPFEKIRIVINRPIFFSRQFTITGKDENTGQMRSLHQTITSSSVVNDSVVEQVFPDVFKTDFTLEISNGDNPPLHVRTIQTYQAYHEMVAYLEAGQRYRLLMDAPDAVAPNYDLQQFQDSFPATVSQLHVQPITVVNAVTDTSETAGFPRKYIWLIMVGVVVLLSFLTWKLTTEMRKTV